MEPIVSGFAKVFFQPPVLILFALAVAGLMQMLQDRSDYRERVNMEWHVRETFYRVEAGFNEELIKRMREQFYQHKYMKEPKVTR